jgi:putative ABC transport system permease protein
MARATARTRELAIRSALGAGRRRIIRQLLTESLVLSAIGGALGIGVGVLILNAAPAYVPAGVLPQAIAVTFTPRVLVFCAVASLVVGLLFGLAPAWQTAAAPARTLASDGRTTTGRGGGVRRLLVAVEVATAVVLLCGAGLLLRTLAAVDHVDKGYRAGSVLTMMVDPLGNRYPTPAALTQFFEAIDRELAAVPGLASAGWTSTVPMGESVLGDVTFEVVGAPAPNAGQLPTADYAIASPSYFTTVDLPIVDGRGFDTHDTPDSAPVCLVNEAVAQRYFAGRSPVGARLALRAADDPGGKPAIREVVGVARQVKRRPDEREPLLQVYVPLAQNPVDDMYLVVRPASGPAEALTGGVRAAIGRVDTEQLVSVRDIVTLDDVESGVTSRTRFRALLVGTFAGVALLLAMIGVFGILAFTVQQRAKEIAVRRALGATAREIAGMLVRSSLPSVGGGAAVGLVLAAVLGPLLRAMLFGVHPLDPLTFVGVAGALAIAVTLAIAVPAWRAVHVDPAVALRSS